MCERERERLWTVDVVDGRKLRRGVVSAVGFFACESEDGTIDLNDLEYVLYFLFLRTTLILSDQKCILSTMPIVPSEQEVTYVS